MSKTFFALLLSKVEALSLEDLETLRDKIDRLILGKQPRSSKSSIVDVEKTSRKQSDESADRPLVSDGWREEYRKCGKSNCWCARSEKRHGPYWYRTVREGDRVVKQYWRKRKS